MARPGRPRNHDPIADEIRRGIEFGTDAQVKALVSSTVVDVPDGEGRTPLMWASFFARTELVNWLIEQGADVNRQDRNGYSALHFVAQERIADVATLLLDAGAQTEVRDRYGNTPLWTASFNARGDLAVVRLLTKHGASFDNRNHAGKTIREIATLFFPEELAQMTRNAE